MLASFVIFFVVGFLLTFGYVWNKYFPMTEDHIPYYLIYWRKSYWREEDE